MFNVLQKKKEIHFLSNERYGEEIAAWHTHTVWNKLNLEENIFMCLFLILFNEHDKMKEWANLKCWAVLSAKERESHFVDVQWCLCCAEDDEQDISREHEIWRSLHSFPPAPPSDGFSLSVKLIENTACHIRRCSCIEYEGFCISRSKEQQHFWSFSPACAHTHTTPLDAMAWTWTLLQEHSNLFTNIH